MEKDTAPLLKVKQWLPSWDHIHWREGLNKPEDHFFIGSISLSKLRRLAAVTTREVDQRAKPDSTHGYQRAHETNRSAKINRYIHHGYPLSTNKGLEPDQHESLINPGWLPNAIIINIIPPGESRPQKGEDLEVPKELEVKIEKKGEFYNLVLPSTKTISSYLDNKVKFTAPIEVIDGQHRLYAIDYGDKFADDYEVPVVIFNNLSLGWQAYLFWTINVEPKKINASLAFDLYPELRRQDWLEQSEAIKVYQEHRSQELTEVLWSHPLSPWNGRIELHGRRVKGHVSNAAFIRSLNSSFIKKWVSGDRVGGLFGSIPSSNGEFDRVLPWKRSQQAAFLIIVWKEMAAATKKSSAEWKKSLSSYGQSDLLNGLDPAFSGEHTLLGTDQGVRAVHNIFNAIFQHCHDEFRLASWADDSDLEENPSEETVTKAIGSFDQLKTAKEAITIIATALIEGFDWRLSSAPGLNETEKRYQSSYRGSGGYSLMMKDLLKVLRDTRNTTDYICEAAETVSNTLIK